MRHDQPKAFELRKQGKTYREIEKLLGVSRSTLCDWFRNQEWSKHIKKSNIDRHIKISIEHLNKMNEGRRIMLEKKYQKIEEDAEKEFNIYKNDPLFTAGLMLYAGEGDKLQKSVIRLANTDFNLHKVFIRFALEFLKIKLSNVKFSILLYPDLDIKKCKDKWSKELNIPLSNFHKPQIIQGKEKIKRLHFGVGSTIICDSFLKVKLLKWIDFYKNYF